AHMGWKIATGSDNAGYGHKSALKELLQDDPRVDEVIDVGVTGREDGTYYPNVAVEAAEKVAAGEVDRALLVCGTGLGVAISANKVPGVRAVTAHDLYSVQRSVLSNNAQVLTMGERVVGLELAKELVKVWLDLEFDPNSSSAAKVDATCAYAGSLEQGWARHQGRWPGPGGARPGRARARLGRARVGSGRAGSRAVPGRSPCRVGLVAVPGRARCPWVDRRSVPGKRNGSSINSSVVPV